MSRRHRAQKREVLPDPKFGDLVVTKFMNYVMYEGKKAVAENIVYGAFDILADKKKDQEPVATFHSALENVAPAGEVREGLGQQVAVRIRPQRECRANGLAVVARQVSGVAREGCEGGVDRDHPLLHLLRRARGCGAGRGRRGVAFGGIIRRCARREDQECQP